MEFEEEVFWVDLNGVTDVAVSATEPDENIHVKTINNRPMTFDKLMEIYATKTRKAQCKEETIVDPEVFSVSFSPYELMIRFLFRISYRFTQDEISYLEDTSSSHYLYI